jgi:hypothetical protein
MKRTIKSKIEYRSIEKPDKIIKAWNKHKAAKKLKTDIKNIREVKNEKDKTNITIYPQL